MNRLKIAMLGLALAGVAARADEQEGRNFRHVLLLSVDVLHRADLARWVRTNPGSALARLSAAGVTYPAAKATTPSDSFPGSSSSKP